MLNTRSEQHEKLTPSKYDMIPKLLMVFGAFLILSFIFYSILDFLTQPKEEIVEGIAMEEKYAPRFEPYADFVFQEEGKLFKLTITDEETIDEMKYFIEDGITISEDYGWDVVVQNMVVLSSEIQEETGESYDFLVMSPEEENEVWLLVEDSQVSYNKFPLLAE